MRCQSVLQPSTAEYWHIDAMTIRFGNSRAPTRSGLKHYEKDSTSSLTVFGFG